MPETSILLKPAPYHVLSYGTLLGTTFFHSFVNGIVQFKTLPRPQFSALQARLFPIYFGIQSAVPLVLAITYPGGGPNHDSAGITGLLQTSNRWGFLVPIATICATGLVNLLVLLPATTKVMAERYSQERKDGKKSYDSAPHSQEMLALNKKFGKLHGISTLLNLTSFIMAVVYGVALSGRIV
ncbi:uncharacterized protein SPSK_07924 [Sporothrix schenckii 1099-18]|uniref:TMEM205-like domain-containing protein n=2 Tax=Sporothrix schenckii TaxID=29908 RepID=U7Q227_SPOS1|nr:uncharacterized protein SPSK_07924 [Sporothrix schenckii 1099-18]ERT00771.1 hypothetical protein HMPREF1624_02004 [Sporothrix schenckii ATCC 58251]KJR87854.1 hypothetical protein SPSK_07924 [Sporothrix schenckii 1099-18]